MDFNFFEKLSEDEARQYLNQYLQSESKEVLQLLAAAEADGLVCDYSTASVSVLGKWLVARLNSFSVEPDLEIPSFIRETESYAKGLFEFSEKSKLLLLRFSYYLGESFVNSVKQLKWAIGNTDTAVCNQPVVTGFRHDMEMATLLVTENIFRRIITEDEETQALSTMVKTWEGYV